jgi:hypothetical protein
LAIFFFIKKKSKKAAPVVVIVEREKRDKGVHVWEEGGGKWLAGVKGAGRAAGRAGGSLSRLV